MKTSNKKQTNRPANQANPPNTTNSSSPYQLQAFSGPIPAPGILAEYERILPGAAERILKMAETQSSHRQHQEEKSLQAQVEHLVRRDKEARYGQWFAFIIAIFAIVMGTLVALVSSGLGGGIITFAGLATIVSAFIYGRHSEKSAEKDKSQHSSKA